MSDDIKRVSAKFPKKLDFLFRPSRYKVAYGGRGSAKSWSFARALLIQGADRPLRILCTREVQKSIKDSVHKLLQDQIEALGLGGKYQVLDTEIRGHLGTEFIFAGLSNQTRESMKSYEGIDIVWAEEAHAISKSSWDILIPTIRKDGSEIWISFNPELDTDETYLRFVVNPPPNCISALVNYSDNPWFPEVLEQERQHCKLVNPDDYETIWEGKCRAAVVGAIYAKEVELAAREGRICNVPYNPMLKVHAVWDLGWNDSMFIILAQKIRSEIAIIEVIEDSHKTLDWYVGELQNRRYNWGYDYLPHDAEHGNYQTGLSAKKIIENFGRKTKIVQNIGVEEGIKITRMAFRQMVFDRNKAARLLECAKRYKRFISKNGEPGSPVHDEYSHGADTLRYLALVADQMTNEDESKGTYFRNFNTFKPTVIGFGG
jgi:phage terminase large subunit